MCFRIVELTKIFYSLSILYHDKIPLSEIYLKFRVDYNDFSKNLYQYQLLEIRPLLFVENFEYNHQTKVQNVIKDEDKPTFSWDWMIHEEEPNEKYCKCHSSEYTQLLGPQNFIPSNGMLHFIIY